MSNKLTYAQKAKQIISKYENRLGKTLKEFDSLSQEALMKELNDLKTHQEAFKSVQDAEQNPMVSEMAKGGTVPKRFNRNMPRLAIGGYTGEYDNWETIMQNQNTAYPIIEPINYDYKSSIDPGDEVLELGNVRGDSNTAQWFSDPNNQAMLMQSLPALVNIGRGLFDKADVVDLPDRTISRNVTAPKYETSEELRNIEGAVNVSRRNLRNSMAGQIAAQVAGNKQQAELFQRKQNFDAQSQFQADQLNTGVDEFNAQMLANSDFREQQMNDAAKAAKEGMLTTGLSQLSTIGQNYVQNKMYSDALESSGANQRAALKQSGEQFDKYLKSQAEQQRLFLDKAYEKPTGSLVVDIPNESTTNTTPKQGTPITAESDKTSLEATKLWNDNYGDNDFTNVSIGENSLAARNNNPFNLKGEYGAVVGNDKHGHAIYNNPQDGIVAGLEYISTIYNGEEQNYPKGANTTIDEFGKIYAEDKLKSDKMAAMAKQLGYNWGKNSKLSDVPKNELANVLMATEDINVYQSLFGKIETPNIITPSVADQGVNSLSNAQINMGKPTFPNQPTIDTNQPFTLTNPVPEYTYPNRGFSKRQSAGNVYYDQYGNPIPVYDLNN